MNPSRYWVCAPTAVLLVAGWLVVLLAWPDGSTQHLTVGLLLGTMFGHTTFAAAWSAFGPGPLMLRLPSSLAVLAMILVFFSINWQMQSQPENGFVELVLGACLLAQWVLVQVPLWGLVLLYGLRLRHRSDHLGNKPNAGRQFGIGQLLISTTLVAGVLALGRILFANRAMAYEGGEFGLFAFLGVTAVVMSLPLLLAALLPRFAVPAVVGIALLIGIGTYFELALLQRLRYSGGPQLIDLIWINAFTSAWILAFVVGARLCGYGFNPPAVMATELDSPKMPNLPAG